MMIGNCDQCHKRKEIDNVIRSTFHEHLKYKDMLITMTGRFRHPLTLNDIYLCKGCKKEVMRAMKNGDNYE